MWVLQCRQLKIFCSLFTICPEYLEIQSHLAHLRIQLPNLSPQTTHDLVCQVLAVQVLDETLERIIRERTGGCPMFMYDCLTYVTSFLKCFTGYYMWSLWFIVFVLFAHSLKFLQVLRTVDGLDIGENSHGERMCGFNQWLVNRNEWESDLPLPYGVVRITAAHIDK